jgi:peptide/nickel transport system ATP-binding protein
MPPLLEVKNLTTVFRTEDGIAPAAQHISFSVNEGELLGIVGESGCGKTITALSIMRLIRRPGEIVEGEVFFEGQDILKISEKEMQSLRGNRIAMVFQEPLTALNPVFTVGNQIEEVYSTHLGLNKSESRARIAELLRLVGIPDPARTMRCYPHELSGGQRQRALIAMSLACNPSLLVADEPTTALDVTVQTQILRLINTLRETMGMGVIIISHDLAVVAEICDTIAVMYASEIVEYGPMKEIFLNPRHPYTLGLLESLPYFHSPGELLTVLPGQVPKPTNYPAGCHFASRCSLASERCIRTKPVLELIDDDEHRSACWYHERIEYKPMMKS